MKRKSYDKFEDLKLSNIMSIFYKIEKSDNGCWKWTGRTDKSGYGRINNASTHRLSYEIYVGEIKEGMSVCHKCDNPPCVNPDHLFLGTAKENTRDMIKKGRCNPPHGSRMWKSKLTEKDIVEIRRKCQSGEFSQKELGNIYNVGQSNISYVINKTWKKVYV